MLAVASVRRTIVILSLSVIGVFGSSVPSNAVGVWDPNDTEGRLDIRWLGLRYVGSDEARLTVVMYPSFRRRVLPTQELLLGTRRLMVHIDEFYTGAFFRKNGGIRVAYGDYGSGCCEIAAVRRPNRSTLVARIDVYPYGDFGKPGAPVYASSRFTLDGERHRDQTRTFRMPPRSR